MSTAARMTPGQAVSTIKKPALKLAGIAMTGFNTLDPSESGDEVGRVLRMADDALTCWVNQLHAAPINSDSTMALLDDLNGVNSLVLCALALEGETRRGAVIRSSVADSIAQILKLLDCGPFLPEADIDSYKRHSFMRGKALVCDVLEQIEDAGEKSDEFDLYAVYRGRGVSQTDPVADLLKSIRFDDGALTGIAAALTGCLAQMTRGNTPSIVAIRKATYDECHGTPDMVYMNEPGWDEIADADDGEQGVEDAPLTGWRAEVEFLLDTVRTAMDQAAGMKGLDDGDASHARALLEVAGDFLDSDECDLHTSSANDLSHALMKAQCMLVGARDIQDTPQPGFGAIVRLAIENIDAAVTICGEADLQEATGKRARDVVAAAPRPSQRVTAETALAS